MANTIGLNFELRQRFARHKETACFVLEKVCYKQQCFVNNYGKMPANSASFEKDSR